MNPNISLSKNQSNRHYSKTSLDSMYSSEFIENFSLSSNSVGDSDDSVNVERVISKTKEMKEIITNRLTVFLYMAQKWVEENEDNDQVKEFRMSVDKTLSFCMDTEEKGDFFVKSVLGQILGLQKEYETLEKRLCVTRTEIRDTEEEEEELKRQMEVVENNVSRFIIETGEKVNTTCECLLM